MQYEGLVVKLRIELVSLEYSGVRPRDVELEAVTVRSSQLLCETHVLKQLTRLLGIEVDEIEDVRSWREDERDFAPASDSD